MNNKIVVEAKKWDGDIVSPSYYTDIVTWAMSLNIPHYLLSGLKTIAGDKYVLSLVPYRSKDKSLSQNNLYWALVTRVVNHWNDNTGENVKKEAFDEIFRLHFFSEYTTIGGEVKAMAQFRVSNATKSQMRDLITTLINQSAKNPLDGEHFAFGLDLASEFGLDVNNI